MKILSQQLFGKDQKYVFEFFDGYEEEFNGAPEEYRDLFMVEDEDE